ncbi:MAG: guanylyl cyclase [Proteobacteria bacterium]|nr:guanylyl cyclase [Pseudomonadota bacterium]
MERRLAAILAADVVGYSRLMEADEEATVRTLSTYREIIEGLVASHHGRVFGSAGDSVIAEFASPVEAVRCAVDIQRELEAHNVDLPEDRRMRLRIGVNLGDVIVEGDNLLGDGVNIAARLETLAEPGGISLARSVFDQVKKQLDLGYEYLGEHEVKNIAEPVQVYRVLTEPGAAGKIIGETKRATQSWKRMALAAAVFVLIGVAGAVTWLRPWEPTVEPASVERMAFPLPDKPSIAVLPFTNMSGDAEQGYFADGMAEDLITDLSKISGLFVIARNSSFVYKGRAVDVVSVGRELGVRYVLEGSVRRSGDRMRITAQLIDTATGGHLWAERYDGTLTDVFRLQDEIREKIIAALAVKLTPAERARKEVRETSNTNAHDAFLQGWSHYLKSTPKQFAMAIPYFERAVALDPEYGRASAALASTYLSARLQGWHSALGMTPDDTLERGLGHLRQAMRNPTSLAHQEMSGLLLQQKKFERGLAEADRAIALNANEPAGYAAKGQMLIFIGRASEGTDLVRRAMRLNPNYPVDYLFLLGVGQYLMQENRNASDTLERASKIADQHPGILTFLIASYGQLGRPGDASSAIDKIRALDKAATVPRWRVGTTVLDAHIWPMKQATDMARLRDGLRKAGLPEFHDEWKLDRKHRLTGAEIKDISFGRTHNGFHPRSRLKFTISRAIDGKFSASGLWNDKGTSRIIGDRICNKWLKYAESCAVIYRNPSGSKDTGDDYILVQRSGAYSFTVE